MHSAPVHGTARRVSEDLAQYLRNIGAAQRRQALAGNTARDVGLTTLKCLTPSLSPSTRQEQGNSSISSILRYLRDLCVRPSQPILSILHS